MGHKYLRTEEVATKKIKPSPSPIRWEGEHGSLDEGVDGLIETIKSEGQLEDIGLTEKYELIWGGRRLEAAKKSKIKVRASIVKCDSPNDILILGAIENLQRTSLSPAEKETLIGTLYEQFKEVGKTQKDLSLLLGLAHTTISGIIIAGEDRLEFSQEYPEIPLNGISTQAFTRTQRKNINPENRRKIIKLKFDKDFDYKTLEEVAKRTSDIEGQDKQDLFLVHLDKKKALSVDVVTSIYNKMNNTAAAPGLSKGDASSLEQLDKLIVLSESLDTLRGCEFLSLHVGTIWAANIEKLGDDARKAAKECIETAVRHLNKELKRLDK